MNRTLLLILALLTAPAFGQGNFQGPNAPLRDATATSENIAATKAGLKVYSHGTTYNGGLSPTITLNSGGGTLSSVTRSLFIPYQMQDGTWRLRFEITVIPSSLSRTQAQFTVAGITFKSTTGFYQMFATTDTNVQMMGYAIYNTGILVNQHAAATTAIYNMAGDVELESKPTWAY